MILPKKVKIGSIGTTSMQEHNLPITKKASITHSDAFFVPLFEMIPVDSKCSKDWYSFIVFIVKAYVSVVNTVVANIQINNLLHFINIEALYFKKAKTSFIEAFALKFIAL